MKAKSNDFRMKQENMLGKSYSHALLALDGVHALQGMLEVDVLRRKVIVTVRVRGVKNKVRICQE